MRVYTDTGLEGFDAWGKVAIMEKERIIERGLDSAFEQVIEERYPDGLSDVELNDILASEDIDDMLGIYDDEDEDDEDDE